MYITRKSNPRLTGADCFKSIRWTVLEQSGAVLRQADALKNALRAAENK